MSNENLILEQIIKEEYDKLLNEFVVPVGFSLSDWKAFRKKHGITNAKYHKEHPRRKWKVVHGHKKGHIGEPLKGMSNMSYRKATKAHAAIAMNENVNPTMGQANQQISYKIGTGALSATDMGRKQKEQAIADTTIKGNEISNYERTLITDLENKVRQLAAIPDVDLVRVRPRIEQMLKSFYDLFGPQIKALQAQSSNATEAPGSKI
jgi:hypothetical protein